MNREEKTECQKLVLSRLRIRTLLSRRPKNRPSPRSLTSPPGRRNPPHWTRRTLESRDGHFFCLPPSLRVPRKGPDFCHGRNTFKVGSVQVTPRERAPGQRSASCGSVHHREETFNMKNYTATQTISSNGTLISCSDQQSAPLTVTKL